MSNTEILTLTLPQPHPRVEIAIGEDLLRGKGLLHACRSFMGNAAIIADAAIGASYGQTLRDLLKAELLLFAGGEKSKTRENKQKFEDELLKRKFGRDTLLVGLGGGVTTDFAAFLASTYMRGVPLILIPTTLLAMVDAAIGGKTGVDTPFGKNLIGSFYQPKAIFVDLSLLSSLPPREWTGGLSEILKYGLIGDLAIWRQLEEHASDWKSRLHSLVLSSIRVKKRVVEEDPLEEKGLRRKLNFGHTVAHALEYLSQYELSHGEAVAIGLLAESWLSHRLGYLPAQEFRRIEQLMHKFPFAFKLPKQFQKDSFLEAIQLDKKSKDNQARFVLIGQIGQPLPFEGAYCRPVERAALEELIEWLKQKYG